MERAMDKLQKGVPASVTKIRCGKALGRRLQDFGLVPGTQVVVRYRSPDGGVTAFSCRGAVLALRTKDLKGVLVEWEK